MYGNFCYLDFLKFSQGTFSQDMNSFLGIYKIV